MLSPHSKQAPAARLKAVPYEQARKATLKYFKGDELATDAWIKKYALRDSFGKIYERTPDDMHRRIAAELARIEQRYPEPLSEAFLYRLLKDFKYIVPQGSPMAGIGNDFQAISLSNCFVIGNKADSYGGILELDEEQVQLMKRRGGVGHDLSHLRPKGAPVMNSALTSTGIVPFMERYSNSTREVAQGGRRGALMLTVSIKHPDAEDFIDAKLEQGKITGANVSVRIDDAFMKAAIAGKTYVQQFPVNSKKPKYKRKIDAAGLWHKIIYNAWKSAEPGVLFWDTILRESVPDCYADLGYETISTNPCGEIPLCPYDSCRLLAINLYSFVENPFTEDAFFNFDKFSEYVQYAQRIMDDILDLEIEKIERILQKISNDPEPEELKARERHLWEKILNKCIEGRRTGVGITAEGDMLAALGLRYGSDEAIDFSVKVHRTLALNAYRASVDLAKARGPFPLYDAQREQNNPFIKRLAKADKQLYEDMKKYGRRNIALLTIAPTGTTSLMTQTTSGIEPAFLISYKRRRKINPDEKGVKIDFVDKEGNAWEEYAVFHHHFATWLKVKGYDLETVRRMPQKELDQLIAQSPYHKATSHDVDWVQKVKMQGAIQKWVDHSISVTVNVPNNTTVEMVKEIYQTAWKAGCKGCTIYRDGSRAGVLLSNDEKEQKAKSNGAFTETNAPKRPKKLEAAVLRFQNQHEKWMAVIGLYQNRPYEIFTGKIEGSFNIPEYVSRGWVIREKENGKARYDFQYLDNEGYPVTIGGLSRAFNPEFWNYAKLISGVMRHGMPVQYVIDLVKNLNMKEDHLNTWKNGVARALKKFVPDGTRAKEECPSCQDPDGLIYREGCLFCKSCGYSECG